MRIAHFGTFDVDNYGDLLFPHIAEWRCPEFEWTHISPVGGPTLFADSLECLNINQVRGLKFDAVIVGGGNIIHMKSSNLEKYEMLKKVAYASLWVGASEFARSRRIPLIFNNPGISVNNYNWIETALFKNTFRNSSYLSFRDIESATIASSFCNKEIKTAPDTAFDVARMWPVKSKLAPSQPYITVHLNQRYHNPVGLIAKLLERIRDTLNLKIKLVPLGPCHGDIQFAESVARLIQSDVEVVKIQSLRQVAEIISSSNLYIGASMHGLITAFAYSTPGMLLLNNNPKHKFNGVLKTCNLSIDYLCKSWKEVDKINLEGAILENSINNKIYSELDEHWKAVQKKIQEGNACKTSYWTKFWRLIVSNQRGN